MTDIQVRDISIIKTSISWDGNTPNPPVVLVLGNCWLAYYEYSKIINSSPPTVKSPKSLPCVQKTIS